MGFRRGERAAQDMDHCVSATACRDAPGGPAGPTGAGAADACAAAGGAAGPDLAALRATHPPVIRQTTPPVIQGKSVPAGEKRVSLFEANTAMISQRQSRHAGGVRPRALAGRDGGWGSGRQRRRRRRSGNTSHTIIGSLRERRRVVSAMTSPPGSDRYPPVWPARARRLTGKSKPRRPMRRVRLLLDRFPGRKCSAD